MENLNNTIAILKSTNETVYIHGISDQNENKYKVEVCNSGSILHVYKDTLDFDVNLDDLYGIKIERISDFSTFIPSQVGVTTHDAFKVYNTSAIIRIADALQSISASLDSINQLVIKSNQKLENASKTNIDNKTT